MARTLVALLLLPTLLLAGCNDKAPPAAVAGAAEAFLNGVVVTEAIVPIGSAAITVTPGDLTGSTDETGVFRIGPVEPGTYRLSVRADGYADTVVEAMAGDAVTKVVMPAVRTDVPYSEVVKFDGYHDCTFDFYVDGVGSQTLPCGLVDCVTGQDVSTDIWLFPFEISAPGLAGILVELVFSDQPAGNQMGMHLRTVADAGGCVDAGGTNLDVQYASIRGPSPLPMWVVQGIENPGADDGAAFHVPQNESKVYQIMTVGRADYGSQADVHLRVQSRQQVFVTMFYHKLGDPSYSALDAG